MAFQYTVILAFCAVACAQYNDLHQAQQVYQSAPVHAVHNQVEYDAPANYDFSYSVHDPHTGDIKHQHESRDGDNVQGSYSLLDSDGLHRIVDYTADELNGFNAIVRREPVQQYAATQNNYQY